MSNADKFSSGGDEDKEDDSADLDRNVESSYINQKDQSKEDDESEIISESETAKSVEDFNQESDEPTVDDGEQGENENQHEQGLDNGADLDEQQDNVEETVLNPEQNSMDKVELNEASDHQPDEIEENISES